MLNQLGSEAKHCGSLCVMFDYRRLESEKVSMQYLLTKKNPQTRGCQTPILRTAEQLAILVFEEKTQLFAPPVLKTDSNLLKQWLLASMHSTLFPETHRQAKGFPLVTIIIYNNIQNFK